MSSISGVNSSSLYSLSSLTTDESSATTSEETSSVSLAGLGSTTETAVNTAVFSTTGKIFNKLQQLQKTDPEKFKELCAEIASKLTAAADRNGGTGASDLAAKFVSAAESGEMTDLVTSTASSASSTTNASSIANAKSLLSQYYAQSSTTQATNTSEVSSAMQSVFDSLGISY